MQRGNSASTSVFDNALKFHDLPLPRDRRDVKLTDKPRRDLNVIFLSAVWSSIMREHPSATLITTRKPQSPVPTPPASSLIILTHQQQQHQQPLQQQSQSQSQQAQQNPLFSGEHKHQYAMDMDMAYGYGSEQSQASSELPMAAALTAPAPEPPQTYLSGPLVIRLRPDGSPVEEDKNRPLPRDDDLETYRLAHNGGISSSSAASAAQRPIARHRKIATISALKQQHFAAIALQRELQPPHPQPQQQVRRQFRQTGYYYGRAQQA